MLNHYDTCIRPSCFSVLQATKMRGTGNDTGHSNHSSTNSQVVHASPDGQDVRIKPLVFWLPHYCTMQALLYPLWAKFNSISQFKPLGIKNLLATPGAVCTTVPSVYTHAALFQLPNSPMPAVLTAGNIHIPNAQPMQLSGTMNLHS